MEQAHSPDGLQLDDNMNKYIYDAQTNAFYPLSMMDVYMASGSWPSSGLEVDEGIFSEFQNPPEGKVRVPGDDGMPSWGDVPEKTPEQIKSESDAAKAHYKSMADSEIAWRQDAVDADIATDEEVADLAKWKKYRVLLMRVDTSNPQWPEMPE